MELHLPRIALVTVIALTVSCMSSQQATAQAGRRKIDKIEKTPIQLATLTKETMDLHQSALVFDGHNGLPWKLRANSLTHLDLSREQRQLHTDIPRLRKGGVGAQFWAIYVDPAHAKKGSLLKEVLAEIDHLHQLVKAYPDDLEMAYCADDVLRIHDNRKVASLIGIEGGHSIENSLPVLRTLHQLGVRYLTLTHYESLDWADSAMDLPKSKGLSKFGEQVVEELNRLGIIVDLSHASNDTVRHALLKSTAPVMFSHSGAHALAPHPRNLPDDILKLVAKNRGIVMVNFYPGFLTAAGARAYQERSKGAADLKKQYSNEAQYLLALGQFLKERPLPATQVSDVVRQIDHIVKVAGIDHVGLGSNFDGVVSLTKRLEDVSCFPNLTQELINRGYTSDHIRKILGGNMLRVLREVERETNGRERNASPKKYATPRGSN
jgi:membrane dipeptidase